MTTYANLLKDVMYYYKIYIVCYFYYLYVKLLVSNCARYLPIVSEIQFKYPTPIENLSETSQTCVVFSFCSKLMLLNV